MELARQLRTKREERGLSQDEVAKAIFVSRQTISNWENDKTYPDMQSLLLLSQLFDTSIDDLVTGDAARIQQAVKQDSHKMRLLSYGMVGFSVLAFLFLLGAERCICLSGHVTDFQCMNHPFWVFQVYDAIVVRI